MQTTVDISVKARIQDIFMKKKERNASIMTDCEELLLLDKDCKICHDKRHY